MRGRRCQRLTHAEKRERYNQYLAGHSHRELAKLWGIREKSVSCTLRKYRQELGEDVRPTQERVQVKDATPTDDAERMRRYMTNHTAESLLDKFHPGWRDGQHLWPPPAVPCDCRKCGVEHVQKWV